MVFPNTYYRHTMIWNLPSGEVANCSVAWDPGTALTTPRAADADDLEAQSLALWNGIKGAYANVQYAGSRLALLSANNITLGTLLRSITPVAATGGGNPLPHEVAVVASLKSATYGRRGRGRIYLPPPAYGALTTTGRLDSTIRANMASQVATYLDFTPTNNLESVVASNADSDFKSIVTVEVGDVFDAQRRRRDQLVEVVSSANV